VRSRAIFEPPSLGCNARPSQASPAQVHVPPEEVMRRRGENLGFAGGHTKMVRTQSTVSELYHTDDRRRGRQPD
jgi:hypothetical protein